MKKALIVLSLLVLGAIFGCVLSIFWYSGANTQWKSINYFPFPVEELIAMKPFGREFWIETTENEIYKVTYPCSEGQTCWEKSGEIPSDLTDGEYVDYKVSSGTCENESFVYPLFRKIKTCITSITFAPDASWKVSLALTDNNQLWIWDSPWESPYTIMPAMFWSLVFGAGIGTLIGLMSNEKNSK